MTQTPGPGATGHGPAEGAPWHRLHVASRTDPGLIRANNEDSFFAGSRVLVVADGMGGHAAGEVASRLVVDSIAPLETPSPGPDLTVDLVEATRRGNAAIAAMVADHPALDGMGTTLTAILFDGSRAALVHVGDSRAYLYRAGVLHQLTHDDTFVQSLVDDGRITEAQAHDHPQRNLVLRALTGIEIDPSIAIRETRPGDRYLLCSDGLSGVVDAESIADALADPDPDVAADALIERALTAGGPDNVTVIVADVVEIVRAATLPATTEAPAAWAGDPSATNPIQQLTREMPRVPLPPIPEEPGGSAELIDSATDLYDDGDDEPDRDDEPADDAADDDDDDAAAGNDDRGGDEGAGDVDRDDHRDDEDADDGDHRGAGGGAGGASADRPAGAGPAGRGGAATVGAAGRLRARLRRGRPGGRGDGGRPAASGTARRPHRRWYRSGALIAAGVIVLAAAATGSAIWVRHQYFVSDQGNLVVVFRGVDGSLFGWHFSTFEETSCAGNTNCTPMKVSDLQPATQNQVRGGIKAANLTEARDVVTRLSGQLLPPCPPAQTETEGTTATGGSASAPPTTTAATAPPTPTPPTPTPATVPTRPTEPAGRTTTARPAARHIGTTPTTSAGRAGLLAAPATPSAAPDRTAPAARAARTAPPAPAAPPRAVTVTETVTATPLAPAPAVPGVTCRTVP